jgi:hypothetical protein
MVVDFVSAYVRGSVRRRWGDDGQRAWFSYFWKPDFWAAATKHAVLQRTPPPYIIIIIIIIIYVYNIIVVLEMGKEK